MRSWSASRRPSTSAACAFPDNSADDSPISGWRKITGAAKCLNASYDKKRQRVTPVQSSSANAVVRATRRNRNNNRKRGGRYAGKVYRRCFGATRLAATLLADRAPCFALRACPALVIKRDCSYISIHFSLEIAEISLPIDSSGKSSGRRTDRLLRTIRESDATAVPSPAGFCQIGDPF